MKVPAALIHWGRLLRLPNLFSVPGDPLAGFLLAGGSLADQPYTLGAVCAGSLAAYLYGLITNDLADEETDRKERPDRPLPSGAITRRHAVLAATVCGLLAVLLPAVTPSSAVTGVLLVLSVSLYNFVWKGKKFWGPASMGLCRFLNVTLGAASVTAPDTAGLFLAGIYATGVLLFICGVTAAAEQETVLLPKRPGRNVFRAGAILAYLALFTALGFQPGPDHWYEYGSGLLSALTAAVFLVLAYRGGKAFAVRCLPREAQFWIGTLIWSLILLQSAAAAASGAWLAALILCAAAVVAKVAAIKFYAS